MKNHYCKTNLVKFCIVFLLTLFPFNAFSAESSSIKDFGFRLETGLANIIKDNTHYLLDLSTENILFSEQLRLHFGVSFLFPFKGDTGVLGVQYIGADYEVFSELLLGIRFQKSYIKRKESGLLSNKTIACVITKKIALSDTLEWTISLSMSPNNFRSTKLSLNKNTFLIKTGFQVYM